MQLYISYNLIIVLTCAGKLDQKLLREDKMAPDVFGISRLFFYAISQKCFKQENNILSKVICIFAQIRLKKVDYLNTLGLISGL